MASMGLRETRYKLRATARLLAGRTAGRRRNRQEPVPAFVPQAATPFDGEQVESRLVWLMGSPRTGSTWLLAMLVHPWILAPHTASGILRPLGAGRDQLPDVVPLDETYLLHHLTPRQQMYAEPETSPEPSELLLGHVRVGQPAYFFSDEFAAAWKPEARRMILARFWSQVQVACSEHSLTDPLVLIKEPNGSHGAEVLMSLLPSSRLLFVVRDGRDVVDSMLDARESWAKVTSAGWADRMLAVRRSSWEWVNYTTAVQRAYDRHPPELRHMVRYEDLRRSPAEALAPILDWLGLARGEAHLRDAVEANAFENLPSFSKGPGKPRRTATPGLWRENMSPEEQDAMNEIMGAKLAELGYETPG